MSYLLVRAEDQLVLGLNWSGLVAFGVDQSGLPLLEASSDARLVLTFPPQHAAEETSSAGASAPQTLPAGPGLGPVPVWRAILSGPSRVAFDVAPGTRLVPTVEGVLRALSRRQLSLRPLDSDGTAIEVPWRLRLLPKSPAESHNVVSIHAAHPVTINNVAELWRTRIVAVPRAQRADGVAEPPHVNLVVVDTQVAAADDPGFAVPLERFDRTRIATLTGIRPARASRLELSSLGGTLVATGVWENYLWEHHAVLGRDMWKRSRATGVLYPLGHRAEYETFVERRFDPSAGGAAVLRRLDVLTVTEPVREPPTDGPARRAFPFDQVEITTRSFAELRPAGWQRYPSVGGRDTYFWPTATSGRQVMFPVRCATRDGDLRFQLPLIFVADLSPAFSSLTDAGLADHLRTTYGKHVVPLPGRPLDLVRAASQQDGDMHEVHSITIEGSRHPSGYRPRLAGLAVALPALRALLDDARHLPVRFADRYIQHGEVEDVVLELSGAALDVSFVSRPARTGGLVAPRYYANAISRTLGPVNRQALPSPISSVSPGNLFPADANLLGFRLRDLLAPLKKAPQITSRPRPGHPPEVQMLWHDVQLTSHPPFKATNQSRLRLDVTHSDSSTETTCTVRDFALELPLGKPLIKLHFGELTCTQAGSSPPRIRVRDVSATFEGELRLLEELQHHVSLAGREPYLDVAPNGIAARYSLALPPVPAGAFVMRNVVLRAGVTVPFDGRPVTVALGFASRENPFGLTVLMFGGGGYVDILIDHSGLRRFEAALEFGALVEVNFLVARAEVHALGGARFVLDERDRSVTLTGYLRIGGCVEILGLVSVSVELHVELAYRSATKALVGRATLVIEIDLWLWSASVELDTGEWVLAGGAAPARESEGYAAATLLAAPDSADDDEGLERWREYRRAFAHRPTGGSS